jgi:hypothetical protein
LADHPLEVTDLISLGFVKNKLDECVFNRLEADGKQSTIVLHVDDMLITASSEERIDTIKVEIETLYPSLSVHRGRKLDYLGMTFDFTQPGKCRVTMNGYITDLMKFCDGIKGAAKTPAQSDLFDIDESSKALGKADAEFYHSLTAKFLYLGKRVRPDLSTAISFLAKRVQSPTEQDQLKLFRVARYLRATQDKGIVREPTKTLAVYAWCLGRCLIWCA